MSHVLGIGLDILSLCRVERLVGNKKYHDRFLQRILSPFEMELFHRFAASAQCERDHVLFLASRFSAKEAAYKALFPYLPLTWKDLRLVKVGGTLLSHIPSCFLVMMIIMAGRIAFSCSFFILFDRQAQFRNREFRNEAKATRELPV